MTETAKAMRERCYAAIREQWAASPPENMTLEEARQQVRLLRADVSVLTVQRDSYALREIELEAKAEADRKEVWNARCARSNAEDRIRRLQDALRFVLDYTPGT